MGSAKVSLIPENYMIKNLVQDLFPELFVTLYINRVPDDFKRPCIVFSDPEDESVSEELTKKAEKETKTISLHVFYEQKNQAQGNELRREIQKILMEEKKRLIPESDGRYITIESVKSNLKREESQITFTIKTSRTLLRGPLESPDPVIEMIYLNDKEVARFE